MLIETSKDTQHMTTNTRLHAPRRTQHPRPPQEEDYSNLDEDSGEEQDSETGQGSDDHD